MILKQGDCLELMKDIADGSVDMILADLPYGTTECKWDSVILFDPLWEQYKRLIKEEGSIVLFGSQPFTSSLIMSNPKMFRYELIWEKSKATQFLTAKLMPMKKHENVLIFTKNPIGYAVKIKTKYNPQGLVKIDKPKVQKHKKASSCISGRGNSEGKEFVKEFTNYPNSMMKFKNEGKTVHPTQKPLDLCEYLVKTYTNTNDLVLDNCMGSGTTGVACVNTNRDFIGFELDDNYFNIAETRIQEAICLKNDIPIIKPCSDDDQDSKSA